MSWRKMIGELAPTVATALGGPFAGAAVNAICDALGLPAGSGEDDIERAVSKDPDSLVKLKKVEATFKAKMKELDVDLERVHAGDRDSARKREVALRDKIPGMLAFSVTFGFFATLYYVIRFGVASGVDSMLVGSLLGTLGTAWVSVVTYYFGSSSGSDKKNDILSKMR